MKREISITVWECRCEIGGCGHIWKTRTKAIPKVCPRCSNPNWDKSAKAEKGQNEEFKQEQVNSELIYAPLED